MEVSVLILDLDEEEADELLLTLDPLAAMAECDRGRLTSLLRNVRTDDAAVEDLLRRTAGEPIWQMLHPEIDPPAQFDKADELQRKWRTEVGQLWRIGSHRLLCGDSTDEDDVVRLIPRPTGGALRYRPALRSRLHRWFAPAELG